jgi:hypothetical protein
MEDRRTMIVVAGALAEAEAISGTPILLSSLPTASTTSANASAGASLMPSPTITVVPKSAGSA